MAKSEPISGRQAGVQLAWPTDDDGNPLALVTNQASELIGLPNYSNVTIGPASVTRFVSDTPESRAKGLQECAAEAEKVLADEREAVLQLVQGQ